MDPFNGLLPRREQKPSERYPCLKVIGVLGVLECILGLVQVGLETTGLTLFYELNIISRNLEIWGLAVGFIVIFAGAWGFLTQLALIQDRARHCMFLIGILLTLLSGCAVFALLRYSAERAKVFLDPDGSRDISHLFSKQADMVEIMRIQNNREITSILGILRASCAVNYTLLGFMFLTSFMLNCKNIRDIWYRDGRLIPNYRSLRRLSNVGQRKVSQIKPSERECFLDKNGSLWILRQPSQAESV